MRKRRSFTDEFKKEAVALVKSGLSIHKVAMDLDLTPSALTRWVRKSSKKEVKSNMPEQGIDDLQKQNQALQKQIRMLTMERDILKKAATFFAKESE